MDVYEAVASRRAVRGFTDQPVPSKGARCHPGDGLIRFCGMSIGFEDVPVDYARTGRAPLGETVTFVGD